MTGKRGFELNMPMGTMTPEKSITIGQVDDHKTVLLQAQKNKEPFFRAVEKVKKQHFSGPQLEEGQVQACPSQQLLFQPSYFSDQLREQMCFMIMLSRCSLFSIVSLMAKSNCMDCFSHRHLVSFFFYLTSHFPSLAYFHSED
jgi:hypothetical protein